MPLGHHRKPFSSKQKKEQLKAKRERKRNDADDSSSGEVESCEEKAEQTSSHTKANSKRISTKHINQQPVKNAEQRAHDPNRFNLQFLKESQETLKRLRKEATKSLKTTNDDDLEIDIEDVYKPSSPLDMPVRPSWSYEMNKEQLEEQERKYFRDYLNKIFESYKDHELSYFEMNLETWRQLWRVLEISDIILLIVDIRFPALHFPPKFYEYCTTQLKKDVILILNKIDLVPTSVVIAWKHYFEKKYPNLHIILFSSSKQIKYRQKRSSINKSDKSGVTKSGETGGELVVKEDELHIKALAAEIQTAKAHRQLYECVKNIVKTNVDLSSWANITEKLIENSNIIDKTSEQMHNLTLTNEDTQVMNDLFNTNVERKKFEHGFVTIGCCGFPNVGKSSLLNSLNGKKVVSVSRTPGHTKHLQTIFLTKTVRLCDCPGLVFPSLVIKPLQVLAGIYPIAQLKEPYSAIRYLAERIPVVDILKLKHPTETKPNEKEEEWSPIDICEAWALKRGYLTAKASRPDAYRAANELLRMALDGRLCLGLRPKNYKIEKEKWENHEETKQLNEMISSVEETAKENKNNRVENENSAEDDDFDEDDEDFLESDSYKHLNYKLESTDEKEKKDESTNDTDVDTNNFYKLLSTND